MGKYLLFIPIILGSLFSIIFLNSLIDEVPTNWEELALGKETHSPHSFLSSGHRVYAQKKDRVIHCESLEGCSENFAAKEDKKTALWLGNSQLHAINQFEEGDRLSSEYLDKKLEDSSLNLLTVSYPSANLQEHFVILNSIFSDIELSTLILGIVFDDFREEGVRHDISKTLSDPKVQSLLGSSLIGKKIIKDLERVSDIDDEFSGVNDTFQSLFERKLSSVLETETDLWGRRNFLRGYFFNLAYKFRNYVFNINPSSKRKMIGPRYKNNWMALEEMMKFARMNRINTIVYVAPIRNDVEVPYDINEYEDFKVHLERLALEEKANFFNLESLVAPEYWGLKDSTGISDVAELDYMHFKDEGHKVLSSRIYEVLQKMEN